MRDSDFKRRFRSLVGVNKLFSNLYVRFTGIRQRIPFSKHQFMKNICAFLPKVFFNRIDYLLLLVFVGTIACGKSTSSAQDPGSVTDPATNVNYTGTFMKSDPTDSTMGNGSVMGVLNPATGVFTYTITWHALSSE